LQLFVYTWQAVQIDGVKIVHYRGALYFATRQHLKIEIMRLTGIDPQKEKRRRKRLEKKLLRQNAAIITENGEVRTIIVILLTVVELFLAKCQSIVQQD
jgi:hypothetical protein